MQNEKTDRQRLNSSPISAACCRYHCHGTISCCTHDGSWDQARTPAVYAYRTVVWICRPTLAMPMPIATPAQCVLCWMHPPSMMMPTGSSTMAGANASNLSSDFRLPPRFKARFSLIQSEKPPARSSPKILPTVSGIPSRSPVW